MKKVLAIIMSIVIIFSLTGCGNATNDKKVDKTENLTCTKQEKDDSGLVFDQTVDTTFVNNEVTDLNLKIDITLDDTMKDYANEMKDAMAEEYKSFSDNGAKVDLSVNENVVTINIYADVKNMTKEQLKEMDMEDIYGTKKDTAKVFEEDGYTCK